MSNKKTISQNVVGTIVDWAMLDQGHVTTLEIKNYLRMKGFHATQDNVSKLLAGYVNEFIEEDCAYDIDNTEYTIEATLAKTGTAVHQLYKLKAVNEPKVALNADKSIVGGRRAATIADRTTVATANARINPRDYIRANISVDSYTLASTLGIPVTSVRAYKAHANR